MKATEPTGGREGGEFTTVYCKQIGQVRENPQ